MFKYILVLLKSKVIFMILFFIYFNLLSYKKIII